MTAAEDAAAEAWVRGVDPDPDPAVWPRPDQGRSGREVALEAVLLYAFAAPYQATAQDDALLALLDDLERAAELYTKPPEPLCAHCGLAPIRVKNSKVACRTLEDLCARCHQFAREHKGALPTAAHNYRQARRLGLLWPPRKAA
ncbi:hypothetical protein K6U06_19790 [Acidiferrimicrobium sp. IK]|uniref:hypothetical protein n=1 Tax=Acidiferrimicrobium sp. IK TaxID=2871700 RepID=UPI0021CB7CD4|nr:hypothetical protein [Acidiferrimicrobium sp. IK]MCU4186617.1 hypothetical protein [Acidiferrimicrobium sp. IK]